MTMRRRTLRIIANHPRQCNEAEYNHREQEQREDNNIPSDEPIVFLEIYVRDPSEFSADLNIHGVSVGRTKFSEERVPRKHQICLPL
jgi:hypothetical protein